MTLSAGTVTVDQTDGTLSGSGLALAIVNAQASAFDAWLAANHPALATDAYKVYMHNSFAMQAEAMATSIVGYFVANAVVTVPVSTNELASGVPSSPTNLTGSIT